MGEEEEEFFRESLSLEKSLETLALAVEDEEALSLGSQLDTLWTNCNEFGRILAAEGPLAVDLAAEPAVEVTLAAAAVMLAVVGAAESLDGVVTFVVVEVDVFEVDCVGESKEWALVRTIPLLFRN